MPRSVSSSPKRAGGDAEVRIELSEEGGRMYLHTNIFDYIKEFAVNPIDSDVLGKAFEPEQRYENPDGTDIVFDRDYLGNKRSGTVIPGPFAQGSARLALT
jgi:hypothetical protein